MAYTQVRVPEVRAKIAAACLAGMVAVEMAYLWWALKMRGITPEEMETEIENPDSELWSLLNFGDTLETINMVGVLGTAVAFMAWLYAAHRNLPTINQLEMKDAPGSRPAVAIYSWFIPIVNWFLPYRVVKETWQFSRRPTAVRTLESFNPRTPAVLRVWWLAWVAMSIVGLSLRSKDEVETFEQLHSLLDTAVFHSIAGVVAAAAGISVVRMITARQAHAATAEDLAAARVVE